ncbi:hypothetical protein KJ840_05500 [Patescibacteria group bacterium]|nr:hypothetical protein [Patescibacteria group bacterium]
MGLYDAAKDAANILKEAGKINEYQKILDLIDDLFNKREEIEKLKAENNQLKEEAKIKEEYIFKNNCYWHKESNDGPFCSRCFDKEKHLIRIIPRRPGSNNAKCPECKSLVNYTGINESVVFRPI